MALPVPQIQPGPKSVVVMGCGQVGSSIASSLSESGHSLHVLDINPSAFDSLPHRMVETGRIVPIYGDGTVEGDLRRAFTQDADIFIAVSRTDACNALAAQMAKHILLVPIIVCRINDPNRKEVYSQLGLITVSVSALVTDMVLDAIGT